MKKPIIIGISTSKNKDNAERLLESALRGCKEENFETELILLRNTTKDIFSNITESIITSEGVIMSISLRNHVEHLKEFLEYLKTCKEKELFLGKKAAFILTGKILDETKDKLFELENLFAELGFNIEKSATIVDKGEPKKDDIGLCVIIGRNITKD